MGYEDAGKETYELLRIVKQSFIRVEVIKKRLENVWYVAGRVEDHDTSPEALAKAIEKYRLGVEG
jgi:hypothetical protein